MSTNRASTRSSSDPANRRQKRSSAGSRMRLSRPSAKLAGCHPVSKFDPFHLCILPPPCYIKNSILIWLLVISYEFDPMIPNPHEMTRSRKKRERLPLPRCSKRRIYPCCQSSGDSGNTIRMSDHSKWCSDLLSCGPWQNVFDDRHQPKRYASESPQRCGTLDEKARPTGCPAI